MYKSWNDYLLTGIEHIDKQHKELVSMLDSLIAAIRAGSGNEEISCSINFLVGYVKEHFATEESHMNNLEQADSRRHLEKHAEFTNMVDLFAKEATDCGPSESLALKLKGELLTWLIEHIGGEDKNLARFV